MPSTRQFKIALVPTIFSFLAIAKDVPFGGKSHLTGWAKSDHRVLKDVPQFVLDYAPLVHLYSKEPFWPSDMGEHLEHTTPYLNWTKIEHGENKTVDNVGDLDNLDKGRWVYLKSNDEIDLRRNKTLPTWLTSVRNKPAPLKPDGNKKLVNGIAAEITVSKTIISESDRDKWFDVGLAKKHLPEFALYGRKQRRDIQIHKNLHFPGRSSAPAILLVVEKGKGVVDAFWFYFYSYNLGNSVFSFRFGNHVGDWEHSVVRFYHGIPKAVFLSQHAGGAVYTYNAVEKMGKRPVLYSAKGTHAMYPTPGIQPYVLPFHILHDTTDRGPLWDPAMNLYSYHYNTTLAGGYDRGIRNNPSAPPPPPAVMDAQKNTLSPSSLTPHAPTSWFYFGGHWGDKYLPADDKRQYEIVHEKAYVSGPAGPRFKALGRLTICPDPNKCKIKDSIAPRHWLLSLAIDYLTFVVIIWTIAGILGSIFWWSRKCYSLKGRLRRTRDGDVETQGRVVRGEERALLAGDRYTDEDG